MCTATWWNGDDSYRLFFNRDELRRRSPALPPTIRERDGVAWIAPTDGDAGGTWIAANAFGITLFLLNGYAPGDRAEPAAGWTSRGSLVDTLADTPTAAGVGERLEAHDLDPYRTFWLGALGPDGDGILGKWIGGALSLEPLHAGAMPLVSSSFDTDAVRRTRTARFANGVRGGASVTTHEAFHASHDPEEGPYSVCMHRPDAHTVSYSSVAVGAECVRFFYAPHAPHEGLPETPAVTLPRRQ